VTVEAREARREELIDAAVRAIRTGGGEVSMEAVAAEAGITKPIVYRHFGSRAGLCQAIARRYGERLHAALFASLAGSDDDGEEAFRRGIDACLSFMAEESPLFTFLSRQPDARGTLNALTRRLASEYADIFRPDLSGAGRDPRAADTWAHAVMGMVSAAAAWWIEAGADMPRPVLRDQLVDLIWNGYGGLHAGREAASVAVNKESERP
jgi:AcrR family transcriptional regulator